MEGLVVFGPVRDGQISLLDNLAKGYKTLGRPPGRVTAMVPFVSVVRDVQLITSTSCWSAVKPVAEEDKVMEGGDDDDAPALVNTLMI